MWPTPQESADLTTFTEEILNERLHFFFAVKCELNVSTPYISSQKIIKSEMNKSKYFHVR